MVAEGGRWWKGKAGAPRRKAGAAPRGTGAARLSRSAPLSHHRNYPNADAASAWLDLSGKKFIMRFEKSESEFSFASNLAFRELTRLPQSLYRIQK